MTKRTDQTIQPFHRGNMDALERTVWAAEYVRYLAARSGNTRLPDDDDVDDAIINADETVLALRRGRERDR